MHAFLSGLLGFLVPAYAISTMASVGAGSDLKDVLRPLKKPVMVLTALIANFVVVPLLALFLIRAFNLPQGHGQGLFLIGCAAGAPFTMGLVQVARGRMSKAGGLLMLLLPATILYVPLVFPWVVPEANVDAGAIASSLVRSMLIPFALAIALRLFRRDWAEKLVSVLGRITPVLLITLVLAILLTNIGGVLSIITAPATLAAAALLIVGGLMAGYALGLPNRVSRVVLSLGTGQRNIAAAIIVASTGLTSQVPLTMVVASSIIGFAILFPAAFLFRRRELAVPGERRVPGRRAGPRDPIPQG